jgi:hypothetical protein
VQAALQLLQQLGQQLHWLRLAAQPLAVKQLAAQAQVVQLLAVLPCLLVELLLVLPVASLLLWVAPAASRAAWCCTASSIWPHWHYLQASTTAHSVNDCHITSTAPGSASLKDDGSSQLWPLSTSDSRSTTSTM